ncbi:MAG: hypothetical protein H0V81_03045, partial [Solirubrobacterales bacterium]|nr:hypothetical protein [Solirubrobacterales bacterium]
MVSARSLTCLAAATVAGALLAPAGASAALPWTPCSPTGYECATLDVPLDRSGA